METVQSTPPGESSCLPTMEALQRQSDKLRHQLSALYQSLENDYQLKVEISAEVNESGSGALQKLRKEEQILRDEIQSIWRKLPFRVSNDQPAEVRGPAAAALRDYVALTGGNEGGWNERDHVVFLHWRSTFRNQRPQFIAAVCQSLPHKSSTEVEDHDKWWRKLTDLRGKQRVELQQWKQRREVEEEERRRQTGAASARDIGHDIHQWVHNWNNQRHTVQQKLNHWKEEKAKLEASKAAEESGSKSTRKQKPQRTEYDKLMAFLWRTEREAAKEASETADDFIQMLTRRERSSSATESLQQRLERDHQWVKERKMRLEHVRSSRTPKPLPNPPKIRFQACHRDPERLLRPTSASMARHLREEEAVECADQPRPNRYVLDISSRMTPKWRTSGV